MIYISNQEFHAKLTSGVSIVIMCMAILIALLFIISPRKVVRDDGTHIAIFKQPKVMTEIKGLITWFTNYRVLALIPGIFVAEMNLVS